MPAVFLSYRRGDTSGYAGRLRDDLEERLGPGQVFRDIDTIRAGSDFARAIDEAVGTSRVLLAVIGNTWLAEAAADGTRRLDDARDFVRLEIAGALRRRLEVIPVLVEGARMPAATDLPAEIRPLATRQAIELTDARWEYDLGRLVEAIREAIPPATPAPRRRWRALALAGVAAAVAAIVALVPGLWRTPTADLAGAWHFPSGNYWVVRQEGSRLLVEETHHDSRQVWRKGTGMVDGDRVTVELENAFQSGYRTRAVLRLSADRRNLTGTVAELPSGREASVTASRR